MEASEKASVASGKAPRRIIFTFCNLLRDEKRKPKPWSPNEFSHLTPKPFSNFLQLLLFLFVGPAKPLWSLVLVWPLTMAYKYRCLELNCKAPRRSLRQLDETRRRIKKFCNYRSQSAAHQSSFKDFFKNLVRYLWSVFPCRLSGYTFRRDMGGTETPTQHFTCRSVRKLSFHTEFIC